MVYSCEDEITNIEEVKKDLKIKPTSSLIALNYLIAMILIERTIEEKKGVLNE